MKGGLIMEDKKKGSYRGFTDAREKANKKYLEKLDEIKIRVPAGGKENIRKHAEKTGKSVNQYIVDAVTKEMLSDDEK